MDMEEGVMNRSVYALPAIWRPEYIAPSHPLVLRHLTAAS
ncbi:hypothetical protein AT5A_03190 [Agrobacterium tumefaciens 5A]|nr:hypothetical protein AT5A_03190 [Agrobacterium tumefaciens 5A]